MIAEGEAGRGEKRRKAKREGRKGGRKGKGSDVTNKRVHA